VPNEGTATDASASRRDPPELLDVGDHIGRYELLSVLGAGGMGVVYRARDPDLERDVALKLLRTPAAGSSDASSTQPERRLLREARAMAKLVHPNLVTVFDVGTYEGRVFVAMEYVEGLTLKQWVKTAGAGWRKRLDTVMAAGRGIAKAHSAGVVHRDLKPDNILVDEDGRPLVADFGLARRAGEDEEAVVDRGSRATPRDPLTAQLTSTGALLGTPAYMSPEQFLGQTADFRSDQFSFAVVVYWALWGRRPFDGDYVEALAASVLMGRVATPPTDSDVPRSLFPVVERALRTRPEERYESVEAFLSALERATASSRGNRRGLLVAVAVTGLALLVAGALVAVTRNRGGDGERQSADEARSSAPAGQASEIERALEKDEEADWKALAETDWEALAARKPEEVAKALEYATKVGQQVSEYDEKIRKYERRWGKAKTGRASLVHGEIPEVLDYAAHGTVVAMYVAAEHEEDLVACGRALRGQGYDRPQGVVIELEIDAKGRLKRAWTDLPDARSHAMADCLGKAMRAWKFPRPKSGQTVTTTLPLAAMDD